MKFKIERVSKPQFEDERQPCPVNGAEWSQERSTWEVDIPSIEALVELVNRADCSLIVGTDSIAIYDDYNE